MLQLRHLFAFLVLALASFAASDHASAGERVQRTTATLSNGSATIQIDGGRVSYRVKSSGGELSCFAVRGGSLAKLKSVPPTSRANGMGCPCGVRCWEDQQEQASICVCRSCGSGGPLPVLIVIADGD